jgi:hypothetical protein
MASCLTRHIETSPDIVAEYALYMVAPASGCVLRRGNASRKGARAGAAHSAQNLDGSQLPPYTSAAPGRTNVLTPCGALQAGRPGFEGMEEDLNDVAAL